MKHLLPILTILAAICSMTAQAQQIDTSEIRPNLRMLARSSGDSVVLRWGTTSHSSWKVANEGGYVVERYEIGGKPAGVATTLTPTPLKPLSIDQWKRLYRPEDTLAGAAVQTLYGAPVVTSDDPFGGIYEMYVQQKNLHGFALLLADIAPRIADGMALRYVDRTIAPGRSYLYRVYSRASNPDQRIDTASVIVTVGERDSTASVESLRVDEGEKEIVLKWDRYDHATPFSGYFIERSFDGGRTFGTLNPLPYIPAINENAESDEGSNEISYKVRLEENYRPAVYRVVGVDAFGERSPGSRRVTAMGRDRTTPAQPQMIPAEIVDGRSVRLAWSLDSVDADLAGFRISKSLEVDGYYEPVGGMLSKTAREFVDRNVDTLPDHFYMVTALDTAGNEQGSVPVRAIFPDSIPPATPMALEGTIDSNGIVVLKWRANQERDLLGYRVFYANQTDHEFQQLTTDIGVDTTFSDTLTLQTLTEEIYYRVTALDMNYNHSEFTATLTLKKPDQVAPGAPVVIVTESTAEGIRLEWQRSPSDDIAEHRLFRRIEGDSTWQTIARSSERSFTAHVDTTATRGVLYEYSLDVRDDAGLTSLRSNVVTAGRIASAARAGIEELTQTINGGAIVLRWEGIPDRTARVYLYKGTADGELALYRSIEGDAVEFADPEVAAGRAYRYGVKVVSDDGRESGMVTTGTIAYE